MLTTSQTALVAAFGPDGYVCLSCLSTIVEEDTGVYVDSEDTAAMRVWLAKQEDWVPVIEYDLESEEPTGYPILCDGCGYELAPACCPECGEELASTNREEEGEDEYGQPICDKCWHKEQEHVQCEMCDTWCDASRTVGFKGMQLCISCYDREVERIAK